MISLISRKACFCAQLCQSHGPRNRALQTAALHAYDGELNQSSPHQTGKKCNVYICSYLTSLSLHSWFSVLSGSEREWVYITIYSCVRACERVSVCVQCVIQRVPSGLISWRISWRAIGRNLGRWWPWSQALLAFTPTRSMK